MTTGNKGPRIYTKTGDTGHTGLVGGSRVSKASLRLETYGTVDELNSIIGICINQLSKKTSDLASILQKVQNELFNIGSHLACVDKDILPKLPRVSHEQITYLEQAIDAMTESLNPLKQFILPGGSAAASHLHLARTVCRRAERLVVKLREHEETEELVVIYLNRLSDFLFVCARWTNQLENVEDIVWQKDVVAPLLKF